MIPGRETTGDRTNPKPGILFVLPWAIDYPGGVNQVVANLIRQTAHDGSYRPLLLQLSWPHRRPLEETADGYRIIRFRMRQPVGAGSLLRYAVAYCATLPAAIARLRALIRRHDIHVVNVHFPTPAAVTLVLLKRLRLFKGAIIISLHGSDIEGASRATGLERQLWRFVLRGADRIVACSESLRETAVALCPAANGSSVTIHNGVDVDQLRADWQQSIARPDLLPARPFILNVGTFEHNKGQDVLVRAFEVVARAFRHLELVIVGRSGPMNEPLKALVRELGLEDRVRLVPDLPHGQVLRLVEKAMLFVLPSRSEAFGIVLLEAGAFGVPVVASNVGGVREFITHDRNGRLVDPDDAAALAKEIAGLLEREPDRRRIAANLRHDVTEKLTWERAYQQYRRLLNLSAA